MNAAINRQLTYLIGPETVLTLASLIVFWFCSRHNSGEGRDVAIMEKMIWAIPFLLAPLAFATIVVPGAKTWWWLGRANLFTFIAIFVCGARSIHGLGSGSKGQDVAFILLVVTGSLATALATAPAGAMILAATKPAFASWFQAHKVLGTIFTLAAVAPIGFAVAIAVTVVGALLLGTYVEFFKR
jgi:hypothetical protein